MFYTYILENQNGTFYIGQTNNISDRLSRHNANKIKSTRNKGFWKLVYKKEFEIRSSAMHHEKYLKSLKNRKYIREKFIND